MIRNLQYENKRLDGAVNQLLEKNINLKPKSNSIEQYGRRNNNKITAIPNSIPDDTKCAGLINSTCTINDTVHILQTSGERSINVFHAKKLF